VAPIAVTATSATTLRYLMTERTLCPPPPIPSCLPTLLRATITLVSQRPRDRTSIIDFCHQRQLVLNHATVRSNDAGISLTIEPLYGRDDMIASSSR
jgi:hypothetical protein